MHAGGVSIGGPIVERRARPGWPRGASGRVCIRASEVDSPVLVHYTCMCLSLAFGDAVERVAQW